jgi:hypothetical protein
MSTTLLPASLTKSLHLVSMKGKTIDLDIAPLSAIESMSVQLQLQKLLGPGIAVLFAGMDAKQLAAEAPALIVDALANLANNDLLVKEILKKFCARTVVYINGKDYMMTYPGTAEHGFDQVFTGALDLMWQFIIEHIKLNYSDFLEYISKELSANVQSQIPSETKA